jgi:DNA ligase-1
MIDFKPMLAKDGDPSNISYPVAVQDKLDGIRASVVNGRLLTRTLKLVQNKEIQAALGRPEFEGLDGELIVGDPTAKGCMQATSSFVMAPNKTGEAWTYWVFDKWDEAALPYYAGFEGNSRFRTLFNMREGWPSNVRLLGVHIAQCQERLDDYEAAALVQGHEGVIVRALDAPYKFGRSGKKGPLLKVKRFIDFEAEVIGVFEKNHNANEAVTNLLGRTERSTKKDGMIGTGTLGGLILVAVNGPHEGQTFRCGTGFDAQQRIDLWEAGNIDGRIAKIKSFPIGVKDLPRFPVWLGWRHEDDFDG